MRAIHGDAPYMRLEPDRVYEICLRSTGEVIITPGSAWRRQRNEPAPISRLAPRASGFVGLPFGATFRPNLTHGIVDEGLYLGRIGADITRFDVLNGAVKIMGADGLLDESRYVAFLHALGSGLLAVQRSFNNCSTFTPASFRICRRVPGRSRL